MSNYWVAKRPNAPSHQHPLLVFDGKNRLHVPLTVFAKATVDRLSKGTARTYLNAILPYFTWLDTDVWQREAERQWTDLPQQVRYSVQSYLLQRLRCKVREHRMGFNLVALTEDTHSTVRVFLSGLKLFYRIMAEHRYYTYPNPLVDSFSAILSDVEGQLLDQETEPQTPEGSGVVEPRYKRRLSDSYFKLEDETWVPKVIDDPTLPLRILSAGQSIGWKLREQCVTRLLFESGGRVSEVTGLTLGDWVARGTQQEATAFSKGSHGRRVKFLRFSASTAKLLRRYFDTERRVLDVHHYSLTQYTTRSRRDELDLYSIPLFLTTRRTQLTPTTYRTCHWNAVCQAAGIEADVHQTRHWYVTMAVRQIYEGSRNEPEVKRRLRELIEYMSWKSGWETLEAYQHYFDVQRHAEIQDELHKRMDRKLRDYQRVQRQVRSTHGISNEGWKPDTAPDRLDSELEFLYTLGGDANDTHSI
jgi:integrase